MEDTFFLHDIMIGTKALGPGNRIAVWFQGCMRNCRGCMSQHSRAVDGGTRMLVSELISMILNNAQKCEYDGITVSGGEPFLQIDALYQLLKAVKTQVDFGVIIYTGYRLSELQQMNNPLVKEILSEYVDILIDGEYIEELNDGRSLVGSSNQQVHFLSDRYINYKSVYESKDRKVEMHVRKDQLFMVGIPDKNMLGIWNGQIKHS